MSLELIYDRTATDVAAADGIRTRYQSLGDWAGLTDTETAQLERGTLTTVTLNRVAAAAQTLAAELKLEIVPQSFSESDIIRSSEWSQYLENIQTLRDAISVRATTPAVPDAAAPLGFKGANDIEKILADLDELIEWMKFSRKYCGTFHSGQTILPRRS